MKLWEKLKNSVTTAPDKELGTNPTIEQLNRFFKIDAEGISTDKLQASTYYACMLIRCNAVAKLPLKLMRETEHGAQKMISDPLYAVLHDRPNPYTTPHDFLWATEFQRLEYGNAFWVVDFHGGRIQGLYLLDSRRMTVLIDEQKPVNSPLYCCYRYNDPKQGQILYLQSEVVHFKYFSKDGLTGNSIRKYLGELAEIEQRAGKVIRDKYKTGLQDPLIVEYVGDLNTDKEKKIVQKFVQMGVKNAGRVVPIPTNFKVTQLETKLVNSQFFELQGLTSRQIANGFGVKGFQLNDMEKSTYNNIEQQNRAFYSDTLQNVLTEYEQEMNYKLLTEAQKKQGCFCQFNVDAILRRDIKTRYESYEIGIHAGFLMPSEARQKENMPFVEGTDRLFFGNGAVIPLEEAGNQYSEGGEQV